MRAGSRSPRTKWRGEDDRGAHPRNADETDAGTAIVSGFDVVHQANQVRRSIGLTGQYASVDEDLTGIQNLVMIGQLLDLSTSQAKIRATELLAEFDLSDAGRRLTKTYSGGMRRRLDLAASLIGRPNVVFLDEPTTGLDPAKRDDVWGMIRSSSLRVRRSYSPPSTWTKLTHWRTTSP